MTDDLQRLIIARNDAQAQVDALNKQIAIVGERFEYSLPQYFALRFGPGTLLSIGSIDDVAFCGNGNGSGISLSGLRQADEEFQEFSKDFPDESYVVVEVKQIYKNGNKLRTSE